MDGELYVPDSSDRSPASQDSDGLSSETIGKTLCNCDESALANFVLRSNHRACSPEQTPTTAWGCFREYNREVLNSPFHPRSYNSTFDQVFSKSKRALRLFRIAPRIDLGNARRAWRNLVESTDQDEIARLYGAILPMELMRQGDLAGALSSFGQACTRAPHRSDELFLALGDLCYHFCKWRQVSQIGFSRLDLELPDKFGFNGIFSRLTKNDIYLSYGWSAVPKWNVSHRIEFRSEELRRLGDMIELTDIPVAAIARAAYRRVIENFEPENRFESSGGGLIIHSPEYRAAQRLSLLGSIEWLNGDLVKAQILCKQGIEAAGMEISWRQFDPYLVTLCDQRKFSEAIECLSSWLNQYGNSSCERLFIALLDICQLHVENDFKTENKWEIALPHLRSIAKREHQISEGNSRNFIAPYFLALAYAGVGNINSARSQVKIVNEIISKERRRVGKSNPRYISRMQRIEDGASKLLNIFDKE